MSKDINSIKDFVDLFCTKDLLRDEVERNKAQKSLDWACEMYKFEMDLYWKRATYFWGFLVVSFTAYFLISDGLKYPESRTDLPIIVNSIGIVFSFGWYLVNRGSKFWQNNWYFIIVSLEAILKLPSHNIKRRIKKRRRHLIGAYPFSVTKVHNIICLFILAIWTLLFVSFLVRHVKSNWPFIDLPLESMLLILVTVTTVCCMLFLSKAKEVDDDIAFIFKELKASIETSSTSFISKDDHSLSSITPEEYN